jgi:arsenate reductase-like glutaredoxin family protein
LLGWEACQSQRPDLAQADDERKAQVKDATSAMALMKENPSVIKRPIWTTTASIKWASAKTTTPPSSENELERVGRIDFFTAARRLHAE